MRDEDAFVNRDESDVEFQQPAPGPGEGPGVALVEMLTRLLRHKRLIAAVVAVALLAGIVTGFILPTRYTAAAKIMPPHETPSSASLLISPMAGSGAGSLGAVASGLSLRNPDDIYMDLLRSRPVADAIIGQFGLAGEYRARDMTAARKKLANYTAISSEKSMIIVISVTDTDKKRAAEMANAYTEQLRSLTKTLALTEASQRRLFYVEQLKHAKEDLIAAELAYQQIQQKRGLVQLDTQAKSMIASLAALRAQVAAKQVQVQALRSYSTDRNPDVQLAERELSTLQSEAASMEQRNQSPGYASLSLKDVSDAGLEYLRAEHEVAYRQVLFDLLIKQYDVARMDESKEAAVIQVVEAAIPPDRKSSPHLAIILLLFPLLGLVGACIFCLIADYIRSDADLSGSLAKLRAELTGKEALSAANEALDAK